MGKADLKINLLVKTLLHRRSMEVRRSGLWAPARVKYLIFRNAPCILAQFTIQQFHCFTPDCRTAAVKQLLYDIEKY